MTKKMGTSTRKLHKTQNKNSVLYNRKTHKAVEGNAKSNWIYFIGNTRLTIDVQQPIGRNLSHGNQSLIVSITVNGEIAEESMVSMVICFWEKLWSGETNEFPKETRLFEDI